jgi:hypothetical protein
MWFRTDKETSKDIQKTYRCTSPRRAADMQLCWLPEPRRPNAWADLLADLDDLGVDTVPSPTKRRAGFDGWSVVVEVRTRDRYRAYWYWMPDSSAADAGERAAARIGDRISKALYSRDSR